MKKLLIFCLLAVFITVPLVSFNTAGKHSHEVQQFKAEVSDAINVDVTYYNPVPEQCDASPLITASGKKINLKKATSLNWCAVSRNLHKRYGGALSFGDVITIKNRKGAIIGKYVVQDLMNSRYKDRIDILYGIGEKGHNYSSATISHSKIKQYKINKESMVRARQIKKQRLDEQNEVMRNSLRKIVHSISFRG